MGKVMGRTVRGSCLVQETAVYADIPLNIPAKPSPALLRNALIIQDKLVPCFYFDGRT